jgi:hypothetical protein
MQAKGTKVRLLAAAAAASLVALGAGSAASAKVRIPELGDGDLPVATEPAPAKSLARHVRLGSILGCGGDAYVFVSNGRRGIAMC